LTDVKPDALLERLSILEALEPQDIADRVVASLESGSAADNGETVASATAEPVTVQPAWQDADQVQNQSSLDWLTDDLFAADAAQPLNV
jgi:exonuclease SbcD